MYFTCSASGVTPASPNRDTWAGTTPALLYREALATPWVNVTKLKLNNQSGLGVIASYRYHTMKIHTYIDIDMHTHSISHAQWIAYRPPFVDSILWPTTASAAVIHKGEQVYLHLSSVFLLLNTPGNAVIILDPGTAWQDSPQDKLSEVRVILLQH